MSEPGDAPENFSIPDPDAGTWFVGEWHEGPISTDLDALVREARAVPRQEKP